MALTPAEIAAMERMETSRCPRSSIKSHDPAIEARRQETLQRVRDHYKGPGPEEAAPAPEEAARAAAPRRRLRLFGEWRAGGEPRPRAAVRALLPSHRGGRAALPRLLGRRRRPGAHGLPVARRLRPHGAPDPQEAGQRQEPEHVRREPRRRRRGGAAAVPRHEEDRGGRQSGDARPA